MMMTALAALAAVCLDGLLGEPRRFHPLVGFGALADGLEEHLNHPADTPRWQIWSGLLALGLLLLPFTALAAFVPLLPPALHWPLSIVGLMLTIGHESLFQHARPISIALARGDEREARRLTGLIVSRDPETLDIERAACESVLENGSDGVFAPLFWFFVAGLPGAVFYRLANTLDAMWGYRSESFEFFGKAAARLDDLLNFVPARLAAFSYALLAPLLRRHESQGNALHSFLMALQCWRYQASQCQSPNAGPVMATGAGALGISLGGPASYGGEWHDRPLLGYGPSPDRHDIMRALKLVALTLALWLGVTFLLALMQKGLTYG